MQKVCTAHTHTHEALIKVECSKGMMKWSYRMAKETPRELHSMFFSAQAKSQKLYSQDFKIVIRIPARFSVCWICWKLRIKLGTYLSVHFIIWFVMCVWVRWACCSSADRPTCLHFTHNEIVYLLFEAHLRVCFIINGIVLYPDPILLLSFTM